MLDAQSVEQVFFLERGRGREQSQRLDVTQHSAIQCAGHCGTHGSAGFRVSRSVASVKLDQPFALRRQAVRLYVKFPSVNVLISTKAHLADPEAGQQRGGL
jgi:hypothetical protein